MTAGAEQESDRASARALGLLAPRTAEIVLWMTLSLFALVLLLPDAFPRAFGSPLV